MSASIIHSDCLAALREMPADSVDAIVTDPPYGLSFMGRKWDYDVPSTEIWAECLRVLKPGGHLLAFAGTRTQHRMAVRIEDAGFEIRDMIAWVYGSGFNKVGYIKDGGGQHVRKGWGGSLKPALEPITMARKPLGTCATNVLQMVESQLRERGVRGEILWKPESASGAARSKKTTNSGSTRPLEPSGTSAKAADGRGTQSVEQQSPKSSERHGISGLNPTLGGSESFHGFTTSGCENPLSPPTAGSAPAAESVSVISSPSTTSTEEEHSTENKFTGRSTHNCAEKDSRLDTASFAGIATGLTGSMGTAHISRDSEGFFLWPKGLPEFVPGSPLTVAANVLAHGTGALNIDGCRVEPTGESRERVGEASQDRRYPENGGTDFAATPGVRGGDPASRWPANLIHDGSDEVAGLFPMQTSGSRAPGVRKGMGFHGADGDGGPAVEGSSGSAARFFYCAKASKKDRDGGLEGFAKSSGGMVGNTSGQHITRRDAGYQVAPRANNHPTVKPTDLMRYLCRLVTPPGGVVLDPFMGSGSTGKAAVQEGFRFVGIEREAEYVEIARARIDACIKPQDELFGATA